MRSHKLRAAAGAVDPGAIVTGAIMHWDFGDTNCWNRTNSTITDLTGNGRNAIIKNFNSNNQSHSYNSSKGGYLAASNSYGAQQIPPYTYNYCSGCHVGTTNENTLWRQPGGVSGAQAGSYNLFGSTSSSLAPFTLEFIGNVDLMRDQNGNLEFKTTTSGIGYSLMTGYLQFYSYTTSVGEIGNAIYVSGNEISEFGFGGTSEAIAGSPSLRPTNNYNPNANFTYTGNSTGWEQLIISRDSSGNLKMYRNGTVFYDVTSSINYYVSYNAFLSSIFKIYEQWFHYSGGWGVMRGYNKVFTQAEVTGQYNAQKSRFGF
jgi:hypothetical protein